MRKLIVIMLTSLFAASAFAANAACDAKAAEQKLDGAAKASFLMKCERDVLSEAKKICDAKADKMKLKVDDQTSFTKKCLVDATK